MKICCFSGGIAVGKTTLVSRVGKLRNDVYVVEEHPENCSFISEFYSDKARWGFHSRIGMLKLFLEREYPEEWGSLILDRTIHELIVFAKAQHAIGILTDKEFELYQYVFTKAMALCPYPNRIILVRCSLDEAEKRLRVRAREFEINVDKDYLRIIENEYSRWMVTMRNYTDIIEINNSGYFSDSELLRLTDIY